MNDMMAYTCNYSVGRARSSVPDKSFQTYFSYMVVVSFIDGGNRITRRKPPTCCKSLTNFEHDSNSQR